MYPEIKTVTVFLIRERIPQCDFGESEPDENKIVCATQEMAEMWIQLTQDAHYGFGSYYIEPLEMIV